MLRTEAAVQDGSSVMSPSVSQSCMEDTVKWLELRRLPPIMGFVGSAPGLVTLLA